MGNCTCSQQERISNHQHAVNKLPVIYSTSKTHGNGNNWNIFSRNRPPIRPSQFLEEKKWPPRGFTHDHCYSRRVPSISTATGSEKRLKHKEWLPNLQKGLNQSVMGNNDREDKPCGKSMQEINTALSLS
ncbi:hypothetical protein RHMOL_Rhmol02G0171200 [Rhododendron molle]|uniref:Uncharacterized protein n=1 Tax=Rhododendron molle TaxID=49168 RepID=A0ACC0PRI5_RHOML|nr:hypothetical protein RHMOL_Rhmol02G0171200 [Rhododendron molle]